MVYNFAGEFLIFCNKTQGRVRESALKYVVEEDNIINIVQNEHPQPKKKIFPKAKFESVSVSQDVNPIKITMDEFCSILQQVW